MPRPKLGCNLHPATTMAHARLSLTEVQPLPAWSRIMDTPRVTGHNDTVGDCVIVAAFNAVQTKLSRLGNDSPLPDDLAVKIYSDLTGYVPGNEASDKGTDPEQFLGWWMQNPIGGYRLKGVQTLNPLDENGIKLAIQNLGVYLCVALSTANEDQEVWTPAGTPGSWGGHAIFADSYQTHVVGCTSWGKGYGIDESFLAAKGFMTAAWALDLEAA